MLALVTHATAAPASTASVPTPPAWRTYPTHLPPPARLSFAWKRGLIRGEAILDWQPQGPRSYRLTLDVKAPLSGTVMAQVSTGLVDTTGLAPVRLTDRRLGSSERALNVQRSADGAEPPRVSFSSRTDSAPFPPGSQDLLSWMVQIAGILQARHDLGASGDTPIEMLVVGVRGDQQRWKLRPDSEADGLIHLIRRPEGPYETQAEVWLDPARHHLPARIRLTESNGESLELTRSEDS